MKGSITVYLSLVFTLILSLFCALIESGRLMIMEAKLHGTTRMAMDSAFAGYASPLLKEYGLLFLWDEDHGLKETLKEHISWNLDVNKGVFAANTDLYQMQLEDLELMEIKYATDDAGEIFAGQVKEYMKYSVLEEALGDVRAMADILGQGTGLMELCREIEEMGEMLKKTGKKASEIQQSLKEIQGIKEESRNILTEMGTILENMEHKISSGEIFNTEKEDYRQQTGKILNRSSEYKEKLMNVTDLITDYEGELSKFHQKTLQMNANTREENKELLKEEFAQLTGEEPDYFKSASGKNEISEWSRQMEAIAELSLKAVPTDLEGIKNQKIWIEELKNRMNKISTGEIADVSEPDTGMKKIEDLLSNIKKLKVDGILGLVVEHPEELSVELLETGKLPSMRTDGKGGPEVEKGILNAAIDRVVYSQYLKSHFSSFLEPDETAALKYEREYLISGEGSDKENLSETVEKIFLIREGCNMISLLKDKVKREEARQLALAIAGFSGMPPLITAVWFLIMGAWAAAESVLDVRSLLRGDELAILKTSEQWNLSLENAVQSVLSEDAGRSVQKRGMNYENYLQAILLMQDPENQYYRTMDLIEANMRKRENPGFRMGDCISMIQVRALYSGRQLFTSLPFMQKMYGKVQGRYRIEVRGRYEY